MEIKFVYLVCGKFGTTVCETYEIAEDILKSELAFDDSSFITRRVLLTKELY